MDGDEGTKPEGAMPAGPERTAPPPDLDKKLADIETKLIEQEHRLIPALMNFAKHGFDSASPYRWATWKALFYALVAGRAATISVGIVAVLGLAVAWQANQLLKEQNKAIVEQVKLSREQGAVLASQVHRTAVLERARLLIRVHDLTFAESLRAQACLRYLAHGGCQDSCRMNGGGGT